MITKLVKDTLAELEAAIKDVHAHCDAAGEHFNEAAHAQARELVKKLWDVANEVDDKLHDFLAAHDPEKIAQAATDQQARVAAEIAQTGAAVTTKNPDPAPGTEAALMAGNAEIPGVDSEIKRVDLGAIPPATEGTLEIKGADAVEAVKELANEPINEALNAGAVAGAVPTPGEDTHADEIADAAAGHPSPGETAAADPQN